MDAAAQYEISFGLSGGNGGPFGRRPQKIRPPVPLRGDFRKGWRPAISRWPGDYIEPISRFSDSAPLPHLNRPMPRRSRAGYSLRTCREPRARGRGPRDSARHEIDMAAYVLTDWPVMQALTRAADRGVKVRIYLDGTQLGERERAKPFQDLAETPTVEIRTKRDRGAPMHLKSYQIDGRLLRSGAANFSASGLKRQDNDLIVIESATAAAAFRRAFDAR